MTVIPSWVVYAAGAFFVLNSLLFISLIVFLLFLSNYLKELKPRIENVEKAIMETVKKVQELTQKVEQVALQVQERVTNVGGKAQGVVGSVELVAQSVSRQFEKFSPFVVGAVTAIRLISALRSARADRVAKQASKRKGSGLRALVSRKGK
jgi:uncharacterized protein YoxC